MGKDIIELKKKDKKRVIGLMSGTSADGIDAALMEIKGDGLATRVKLIAFETYPYSESVRKKIFDLFSPETGTVDKVCHLNFVLGELFARAALRVIRKANLRPSEVDSKLKAFRG